MASSLITIDTRGNDSFRYNYSQPQPRQEPKSASSISTDSRPTTWRHSGLGPERLGKGSVLFTGPDGIRDHRVSVQAEHRYVGEGTMSPEGTSEVEYLWRPPSTESCFPRPKSRCVGEIGWGIPAYTHWSAPWRRAPIELAEFRQAAENRHTHLYQNAWYPGPNEHFPEDSDLGLVMNVYKSNRGGRSASHRSQPATRKQEAGNGQSAETQSYETATIDTRDTGYVSNERQRSAASSRRSSNVSIASRHSSAHSGYSSHSDLQKKSSAH